MLAASGQGYVRPVAMEHIVVNVVLADPMQATSPATTARATMPSRRPPPSEMTIELSDLRYEYVAGPAGTVVQQSPVNVEAFLTWLRAAGIDTSSDEVRAEARTLTALVEATAAGGSLSKARPAGFAGVSPTQFVSSTTPVWFWYSAAGLWALLWLLGVWLLVRTPSAGRTTPHDGPSAG